MKYIIWIIASALLIGIGIDLSKACLIAPGVTSMIISIIVGLMALIEYQENKQ